MPTQCTMTAAPAVTIIIRIITRHHRTIQSHHRQLPTLALVLWLSAEECTKSPADKLVVMQISKKRNGSSTNETSKILLVLPYVFWIGRRENYWYVWSFAPLNYSIWSYTHDSVVWVCSCSGIDSVRSDLSPHPFRAGSLECDAGLRVPWRRHRFLESPV